MTVFDHKPTESAGSTAEKQRRLRVNYSLAAFFFFFLGKVDTVLLAGHVESKPG